MKCADVADPVRAKEKAQLAMPLEFFRALETSRTSGTSSGSTCCSLVPSRSDYLSIIFLILVPIFPVDYRLNSTNKGGEGAG